MDYIDAIILFGAGFALGFIAFPLLLVLIDEIVDAKRRGDKD